MRLVLTSGQKLLIVVIFFTVSITGFLIKLPTPFRHSDKELHGLFYFFAAAFLNVLYAGARFFRHITIFIFLYLFGLFIEYAQAYSNNFFPRRIHGRYDPEDVAFNLKGLLLFSFFWMACVAGRWLYRSLKLKQRFK